MTEASRVQKLLTEQTAEIDWLKNRIEKLETANLKQSLIKVGDMAHIEKLEAEVERLVKSRNKWGKLYNQTLEKLRLSVMSDSEYVKIIDEKCAEQATRIEKLEAALRMIAQNNYGLQGMIEDGTDTPEAKAEYYAGQVTRRQHIARKALEGKDD